MHSLARDERFQYDRRSEETLGETLAAFAGFDSSRLDPREWKFLARREQLSVHRAVSAVRQGVDCHKRRVVASGFLSAGLSDVVGGLYVEDDRELLTTQAILNPSGNTAVDAAVLLITERRQVRAAPFRFAGVKWYSWKKNGPVGSLGEGQECDLLTYERMGMALAEEGGKDGSQELAYHVMLSLNKPEWPLDVARGPGLRRADMAFCFLFRKVCEDLVECFALVDYDCRTAASSRRAADSDMADRILMVTRLPECARAKVLSGYVRKARGRPVLMSKTCLRCGSRQKVTDPLRSCGVCKKSVCRKCYEIKAIFSLNSRTHDTETDVFCRKCLARIDILTAKKNAQHNTSASANSGGSSSTGGSSRDKDRESHSGGSSESSSRSSSRSSFKFWKKSKEKREPSPRSERDRRRHSLPATMIRRAERHTPNYEGLFQHYDVFGRASDNPQRRCLYEEELEVEEEQEPETEREGGEPPPREKRRRQTTYLANPEAAAAEANRIQRVIPPVVREREYTVAEVYPVAKTVLETEEVSSEDGDESPHSEAERAHLLYLERRQRLDELKDQRSFCRREALTALLPIQEAKAMPKAASFRDAKAPASTSLDPMAKANRSITGNQKAHSKSAPALHAEKEPAASISQSARGARRGGRQQESDDTFRMDLYGRF
ncbi:hypothetical protein PHYPSEUDO_010918 [Phytophthora pseudosyringae]|uniref:FYVE-type domain-containing protein n=1 Tax=Phytophthora pseudosyringae TaxID=221518 RepID=A0A8T1V9V3_9STRA|nr:hypothetical protein PHYPSEUDO_010918 [Phytophthora pseudosyringae]